MEVVPFNAKSGSSHWRGVHISRYNLDHQYVLKLAACIFRNFAAIIVSFYYAMITVFQTLIGLYMVYS